MATGYGTGGSLNNCVLYLDASNPKSYPGAGTTWYDLSGNNLNATLTNGPIWGANNQGVINYDGTNDYVATGTSANLNFSSSDFSVELWVYMNSTMGSDGVYHGVLSIGTTTGGETFLLGIWRSGLYPGCFYSTYGTATNYMFGTNGNDPNYTGNYYNGLSKWTHVVFTKNGGTSYFYLNGQLWASKATPSLPSTSSNFVSIGLASGVYLIGQTPLLRIYNRALTATEAFNNFAATRNRFVGSLPFSPTDISGLKLWLDADDSRTLFSDTSGTTKATTDGTAVALWVDKSGSGYNGNQSTASNRPTLKISTQNGRNILRFDGNDRLDCGDVIEPATTITLFAVAKSSSTGQYCILGKGGSGNYYNAYTLFFNVSGTNTHVNFNTSSVGTGLSISSSNNIFYLVSGMYNGSNIFQWQNGSPATTALTGNLVYNSDNLRIGMMPNSGNSFGLVGDIAEVLIYNVALTASQRIQVETYLNNKWGLWASFNPSSISGLQLWLDSSDPATLYQDTGGVIPAFNDGDPVALWKDKSGNGKDASQSTTANRPALKTSIQNSKNILRFDGSNDGLAGSDTGFSTTTSTVFIVCKSAIAGNDNYPIMFGTDASTQLVGLTTYSNQMQITQYGDSTSVAFTTNAWNVVYFTKSSNSWAMNLNGTSASKTMTTATVLSGNYGVGFNKSGNRAFFNGDIAEILIYNSVLTTAQLQQVQVYLNQKWGVF